jgi:hypothetical protein
MLAQMPSPFALAGWATLVIAGVGVVVAALVVALAVLVGRWRRRKRLGEGSKEEDLPWEDLLELLRRRSQARKEAGLPPDDDVPPEELLKELLAGLPARAPRAPAGTPEGVQYLSEGGVERRAGRRRWGNPTEVSVTSPRWPGALHGLVINRSTGGLAVFLDGELPAGTPIKVRPVEAPGSVPGTEAEVRYCRKVGKHFLIGCEFSGEVPWNVRVWFG